jgi:GAF domain-containing protein
MRIQGPQGALSRMGIMASTTPLPKNEEERLSFLRSVRILDTPMEECFERITRLLCRVLEAPIAAVSLVDVDRQWFKSIRGLEVCQCPRAHSFCSHTILQDNPLIVSDASTDPRFAENRFVAGQPHLKYYAGVPLLVADNVRIGAVCIFDTETRELSENDLQFLLDLAATATSEIKSRLFRRIYA